MIISIEENLNRYMQDLCLRIGSRHVGSDGEKQSADYIESAFHALGYTDIKREYFPSIGWRFRSFLLYDLDDGCAVPTAVPCFFSRSVDIADSPLWLQENDLAELDKIDVKNRLCIINTFSFATSIGGRNGVAEQLDKLGAAGAIFFSDSTGHTSRFSSTKFQRSPYLDQLGTAAVAEEGAIYLAKRKTHRYLLKVDADKFPHQSCNVVATRPGSVPGKRAIAGAHYDTAPLVQGALDNASGIASVLEAARILKDQLPEWTFDFVAFSAEEYCIEGTFPCGSHAYIKAHPDLPWKFFLNYDVVGAAIGEPVVQIGLGEKLPEFHSKFEKIRRDFIGGDNQCFCHNNIPAIYFYCLEPFRVSHTPGDTLEYVDMERLADVVQESMKIVKQIDQGFGSVSKP